MMITVTFKGLDKLMRDLAKARKQALPFAVRETLTNAAFATRKAWQDQVRKTFTMRNEFTVRSIRVDRATSLEPSRMVARVGSVASYAGQIEQESVRRGGSAHWAIPTAVAAGMAPGSRRTKAVKASARLRAIQAVRAQSGTSKAQRNAVAMAVARKRNEKYAVLERKTGGKALFRVYRRLPPRMVWDLSRRSVHVPAHPTLEPALRQAAPQFEAIAMRALEKQLRRHGLFGY